MKIIKEFKSYKKAEQYVMRLYAKYNSVKLLSIKDINGKLICEIEIKDKI